MRAVDVRGVEEEDSEIERAMYGRDGLGVIEAGVELRHPHAAEPLGWDLEAGVAEITDLHKGTFRKGVERNGTPF